MMKLPSKACIKPPLLQVQEKNGNVHVEYFWEKSKEVNIYTRIRELCLLKLIMHTLPIFWVFLDSPQSLLVHFRQLKCTAMHKIAILLKACAYCKTCAHASTRGAYYNFLWSHVQKYS